MQAPSYRLNLSTISSFLDLKKFLMAIIPCFEVGFVRLPTQFIAFHRLNGLAYSGVFARSRTESGNKNYEYNTLGMLRLFPYDQ